MLILIGKSGAGKDAILQALLKQNWKPLVSCTTRPMRVCEENGKDYFFLSKEEFLAGIKEGYFIEYREYHTLVNGTPDVWYYGLQKRPLSDDSQYVTVLDVTGAKDASAYYGKKNCKIIFVDASDYIRRKRAEKRGSFDAIEWNRRLADDAVKFQDAEKLADFVIHNEGDLEKSVETLLQWLDTQ